MTVSTFYVEEFQILVILSFKLKTSQINGNKTLTDIQNFYKSIIDTDKSIPI